VVTDDSIGEQDPLLARLLAAATSGAAPAGPADKRKLFTLSPAAPFAAGQDQPKNKPKYVRRSGLLRRVLGPEVVCPKRQTPLRLISLIRSEIIARKILVAIHVPADVPSFTLRVHPGDATGMGGKRKTT
jgi:hypothetical protein